MHIPFIKYDYKKKLDDLPKITQEAKYFRILLSPSQYRLALLKQIRNAKQRIYLIVLYLENDEAGQEVLEAIYAKKKSHPNLDIKIFVDWHRAQRSRIGETNSASNLYFYCDMKRKYPDLNIAIYGVPINQRELFGVLHLKGSIIDNTVLYTGASINNVYLHKFDKYRYDRYHIIGNKALADSMVDFVNRYLTTAGAVQYLDTPSQPRRRTIKLDIESLRQALSRSHYQFMPTANKKQLSVSPMIGLGKHSILNKTIHYLLSDAREKIILSTPYFNLPAVLIRDIVKSMKKKVPVEIIVGDKVASDFYIPKNESFHIAGGLPYFYEINLRKFIMKLQPYIDNKLLSIRLWKDGGNSYHLKGIWVDSKWFMITGNNLNPRAWRLDLENAILIHDPNHELKKQFDQELEAIRKNTHLINHYQQIQDKQFYPKPVLKLIKRLSRIKVDKLIKRLL